MPEKVATSAEIGYDSAEIGFVTLTHSSTAPSTTNGLTHVLAADQQKEHEVYASGQPLDREDQRQSGLDPLTTYSGCRASTHTGDKPPDNKAELDEIRSLLNKAVGILGSLEGSRHMQPQQQQLAGAPATLQDNHIAKVQGDITTDEAHAAAAQKAPLSQEEQANEEKEARAAKRKALLPFAIISLSYLLYTMTDGSVRMIVLLHAYNKGFTAMEVAVMFSMYETAGVVTNLLAGMAGAKWGIKWTLLVGLTLQLCGLGMLFGWQDSWSKATAIIYVTIAQMLCGIAKDLTKLGGKTVTKLVTPDEKQSALFKLVSYITGFKNSLKGVGYFIGAGCITASDTWGLYLALGVNVAMILLAYPVLSLFALLIQKYKY